MKPINLSSVTCAKARSRSSQTPTDQRAPPLAAKAPRIALSVHETVPQTVFHNLDLFLLIAENITDTSTLLHFFESCETARQAAEQLPTSMIKALLNTLPLEIRQTAVAILALDSIKLSNSGERERFINTYLSPSDQPVPKLSDPTKVFVELRVIAAAAETFTPLYVNACMENLERVEAVRLARNPQHLSLDYCTGFQQAWRWHGDETKELTYGYHDLYSDKVRRLSTPSHQRTISLEVACASCRIIPHSPCLLAL